MKQIKKVYIAGKLNDMSVDYIKNLHYMIKEADKVRKKGFSVYVPCLDILMGLVIGNYKYKDYFNNSQPWLESSDAIYVLNNYKTSKGTLKEIETAHQKHIPIFYNLEDLIKYRENLKKLNDLFDKDWEF